MPGVRLFPNHQHLLADVCCSVAYVGFLVQLDCFVWADITLRLSSIAHPYKGLRALLFGRHISNVKMPGFTGQLEFAKGACMLLL